MVSQDVVKNHRGCGIPDVKPPTSEGGMESKVDGLLDSRPPAVTTTVPHDEEKGQIPLRMRKPLLTPFLLYLTADGVLGPWF